MMQEAESPAPDDRVDPGSDDAGEVYGLMDDLDALEELIEDLDELGLTTRDAVDLALIRANKEAGNRQADALISRLEDLLETMEEFRVASREDIVAKLSEFEEQAEEIELGERTFDS
jgi:NifB/MoaA-like Fe-S oxidoreductase